MHHDTSLRARPHARIACGPRVYAMSIIASWRWMTTWMCASA